jgi:hypothetical protein
MIISLWIFDIIYLININIYYMCKYSTLSSNHLITITFYKLVSKNEAWSNLLNVLNEEFSVEPECANNNAKCIGNKNDTPMGEQKPLQDLHRLGRICAVMHQHLSMELLKNHLRNPIIIYLIILIKLKSSKIFWNHE